MAQATQYVQCLKLSPPVKESSFYLMIDNIDELLRFQEVFQSKNIQFLDGDTEWWISLRRYDTDYLQLIVHILVKEHLQDKEGWHFIFSASANGLKINPTEIHHPRTSGTTFLENATVFKQKQSLELKIKMRMSLSPEAKSDKILLQKFTDLTVQYKGILSNNELILDESKYTDFTFVVPGKKFKVHKCILAAASRVFDKIFSSKLKETHTDECQVADIDSIMFSYLLRFIYYGELPKNIHEDDISRKLHAAAHYYEIQNLVEICKQIRHFNLSVENAEEMYCWAVIYELKDVMLDAWKIIKLNILGISTEMEPPPPADITNLIEKKRASEMHLEKYRLEVSAMQEQ